jgi:hypothetical protein
MCVAMSILAFVAHDMCLHHTQDPGFTKAEAVRQLLTELASDPGAAWLLWTDVQVNPQ